MTSSLRYRLSSGATVAGHPEMADYLVQWEQSGTPGDTIIYNVISAAEAAWFAALDSEEITDPANAKLINVTRLI